MQWLVCHALIICMYTYTTACMNVYSNSLQVNIMNVSGETLYECSLSGKLAKVASVLAGGEKAYSHLVKELFSEDEIRKHIVDRVVTELDDECSQLCTVLIVSLQFFVKFQRHTWRNSSGQTSYRNCRPEHQLY